MAEITGPAVAPTIDDDVDDQYVMLGEHWELHIRIGGDDPFELKVEKDNVQLPATDRMKISFCNGIVTMSISDVKVEDSGVYKLEVSNECGEAHCIFNVAVDEDVYRRVINKNRSQFLVDLDPTKTLDAFIETEYISKVQARDISELPTTSEKIRKILDIVTTKGQKGYDDFKDCLWKNNQDSLVELLENTEIEMKGGSDVPKANTKTVVNPVQRPVKTKITDIQQKLIDVYQSGCFRLPMSPLFKDENQELLKIYKIPSLSIVDYHNGKADQKSIEVKSCRDIFYQDHQPCRNIYITGDAGVGKSSFCMYLSLLWSMSHMENKIINDRMQEDAAFLAKFDYLFYVTLRDTAHTDVIAMIVDQLFHTGNEGIRKDLNYTVANVLKYHESLVIIDGLDEWSPECEPTDKRDYKVPHRPILKKGTFLTSCRPYKIENVRLVKEDLDRQVKMTGLHGSSMKSYIADIVKYINEKYDANKNADDFFREAKQCGLHELLCIPIITSNLVMVWLDQPLTAMSRSLIYCNIVEMLFKIAKDKKIEFPSTSSSLKVQLPTCLSDLVHFREYFSLLKKVCLLSFRSLFKQDDCVTNLVFTTQQLMSEPYILSSNEVGFLCKIGILSKNKVIRRFGMQEHKLSFLHKSYLEFFAAVHVSLLDASELLNTFNTLTTISDVLQFENCFLFVAGFSPKNLQYVFEKIYLSISNELTTCRTNAIFHYNALTYEGQIESLQETVINCFVEGSKFSNELVNLKHEDFVFDDSFDVVCLKRLLVLNSVISIHSSKGEYLDEFNDIKTLQCLHVEFKRGQIYDEKFTELMVQNASTLHTVCIEGHYTTLIPAIPWSKLNHLSSLGLSHVKMQHTTFHNLVTFLSNNVHIANIKLHEVSCNDIQHYGDNKCIFTLNLQNHTNLNSLDLHGVDIVCNNINKSSLKSISLRPLSKRIVNCYVDVFKCIKDSQLDDLQIYEMPFPSSPWPGYKFLLDDNTMKTFAVVLKTLRSIKSLQLYSINFPSEVLLQLHPDVSQVKICLSYVNMSRQCFHCFIESLVSKYMIKVKLHQCYIISVDGEMQRKLSYEEKEKESMDYMSEYIASLPTINITYKSSISDWLHFETTNCL